MALWAGFRARPRAVCSEGDITASDAAARGVDWGDQMNGERAIRIASWLFLINGIAWGLGSIPNAVYRYQLGRMPRIGDLETMGGPVSSQFGWEGVVWFLIPMGLLAWVEALAGWWLRKQQKQGGGLSNEQRTTKGRSPPRWELLLTHLHAWLGSRSRLLPRYLIFEPGVVGQIRWSASRMRRLRGSSCASSSSDLWPGVSSTGRASGDDPDVLWPRASRRIGRPNSGVPRLGILLALLPG